MSKRAEIREKRQRERRQRRLITLLFVFGGVLVILAPIIWVQFRPIGEIVLPETRSYSNANGTALGDPEAQVVIEEFSDFRCSHCGNFHQSTLGRIIDQYVNSGQVYFVFKTFPLSQDSIQPMHASFCAAEQGMFWEYADVLFANQDRVLSGTNMSRLLEAFAEGVNLDLDRYQSCMRADRYQSDIEEAYASGVTNGISSTPSFLINGKLVVGNVSLSTFQTEIESALASSE
jgi:protein-disulfide isomerase